MTHTNDWKTMHHCNYCGNEHAYSEECCKNLLSINTNAGSGMVENGWTEKIKELEEKVRVLEAENKELKRYTNSLNNLIQEYEEGK